MHTRLIQLIAMMLLAVQGLGAALAAGLASCECTPMAAKSMQAAGASTDEDDACGCRCGCCGSGRDREKGRSNDESGLPGSPSSHQHHRDDACGGCAAVNMPIESTVSVVLDQAMRHIASMAAAPAFDAPTAGRDRAGPWPHRPPPGPPLPPTAALVLASTRMII